MAIWYVMLFSLVGMYLTAWHHIPEYHNVNTDCRENLRFNILFIPPKLLCFQHNLKDVAFHYAVNHSETSWLLPYSLCLFMHLLQEAMSQACDIFRLSWQQTCRMRHHACSLVGGHQHFIFDVEKASAEHKVLIPRKPQS